MWNYLLEHPGVLPMWPSALNMKSNHYFYCHYENGAGWYRSHFATTLSRRVVQRRLASAVATGEASPYYLYDPRVPSRVRAVIPDVRVMMLLRDPVERAYSHYKERQRAGVEELSFEAALDAEPRRLSGEVEKMLADPSYYSRPHDWYSYRDRGVYHPQVERWLAHFHRSSLLILPSERLYSEPQRVFDQMVEFIGLPPHQLRSAKPWNYHPSTDMRQDTRQRLREFYRPHNDALCRLLDQELGWG